MPAVALLAILLQTATSPSGDGVAPPPPTATRATAVRAKTPAVIDGRDDDEVWRMAPAITQFREFQPKEDGDPRFATEAKVAYDDRYLYVFIRAFDPHPDSILKLLARRDVRAATDQLKIMIDSYPDRRNGFEFAVNPDFGQVEADPSVLNLTAFETFFQERRPFFVQGAGIFRFDVNCSQVNCNGEGLFYSRRIGRAPQLDYGEPGSPTATTIYGAAKLTGRLPGGQTVGVLDAVTQRAASPLGETMEPTTNYAVVRTQQDFRNGESGVGMMVTAVNRNLDRWTDTVLRRSAYVGAVDLRHRFLQGHYRVSGSFDLSRVAGTDSGRTSPRP